MFWAAQDPFASAFGSSFADPARYRESNYSHPAAFRRSRNGYDEEDRLLRQKLYQQEMHQRAAAARNEQRRLRERHRRHAETQAAGHARRVRARRLAVLRYTMAARKIQRWWRAMSAARQNSAAKVIATALRRYRAVRQARRIVSSVTKLRDLEATIKVLPEADAKALDRRAELNQGISEFENTLEKLILSADDIPTYGSETARAIRKRLVKTANTRLQKFDQRLVALKTAMAEKTTEETAKTMEKCDKDTNMVSDSEGSETIPSVTLVTNKVGCSVESEEIDSIDIDCEEQSAIARSMYITQGEDSAPQEIPSERSSMTCSDDSENETSEMENRSISSEPELSDRVHLQRAMDAHLIETRSYPCSGCSSECSTSQRSAPDSSSDTSSELSFVEIEPESAQSEDDGGESLIEMNLIASAHKQPIKDNENPPNETDNWAEINALVSKFVADVRSIELGKKKPLWNDDTARDLQTAVEGVLRSARVVDTVRY